jgi:excisionase family DNA binding protein
MSQQTLPPQTWLTRKQLALTWSLSLRTIDTLLAAGKLPHFRIGGAVRFDPTEVETVMRERYHIASQTRKGHTPNS